MAFGRTCLTGQRPCQRKASKRYSQSVRLVSYDFLSQTNLDLSKRFGSLFRMNDYQQPSQLILFNTKSLPFWETFSRVASEAPNSLFFFSSCQHLEAAASVNPEGHEKAGITLLRVRFPVENHQHYPTSSNKIKLPRWTATNNKEVLSC